MRGSAVVARAALAASGAVGGVALLLGFRTPDSGTPTPVAAASGSSAPPPAATSTDTGSQSSGSSAAASASARKDGTWTGQDEPNEYGDVQVQVVVSGGKITDVRALQLPSDRARSQYISQVAGPLLHDEAIQAQSAQIDTISGATFTSDSYARSLQSALDQAH